MALSYQKFKAVLTFCFCTWTLFSTSLFLFMMSFDKYQKSPLRSANNRFTVLQLSSHHLEKTIHWVLPVYKSAWSLDIVLKSYINANITRNVSIFKHAKHTNIDAVIRKHSSQIQLDIVDDSFAWTQFTYDNGDGDSFGNPKTKRANCSKNYWWWIMDTAWASSTADFLCVMADDMVIKHDTKKWIQKGLSVMNSRHVGFKLHNMNNFTVPFCMRSEDWLRIKARRKEFFNNTSDFNWDQVLTRIFPKNITFLMPSVPLAMNILDASKNKSIRKVLESGGTQYEDVMNWCSSSFQLVSFEDSLILPYISRATEFVHPHCMKERHSPSSPSPSPSLSPSPSNSPSPCPYLSYKRVGRGVWRRGTDFIVELHDVSLDMSKVKVTHGGENVSSVLGRKESAEFPKYSKSAWTVPYTPSLDKNAYQSHIFKSAVIGKPKSCSKYYSGTTVAYERGDYANFYFTINDWYNMHTIYNLFNLTAANIMWLDGHPKGHFDDVWPILFNAKVDRIGSYIDTLCFEHIIWMPKGSPIYHHAAVDGCTINDFVRRVKRSFRSKPNDTKHDTIIERKPYMIHPRIKDKYIDRVLSNMEEVRRAFPAAKVVRMELLTFAEQMQVIVNTKTLYGVHGAGLSWGLFLEPGSKLVEWVPESRESTLSFQQFASWRPDLTYERVKLKPTGDGNSWILPLQEISN